MQVAVEQHFNFLLLGGSNKDMHRRYKLLSYRKAMVYCLLTMQLQIVQVCILGQKLTRYFSPCDLVDPHEFSVSTEELRGNLQGASNFECGDTPLPNSMG